MLKFLKGLNRAFESRRAALTHLRQLPNLEDAIETRLKQIAGGGGT